MRKSSVISFTFCVALEGNPDRKRSAGKRIGAHDRGVRSFLYAPFSLPAGRKYFSDGIFLLFRVPEICYHTQ